MNPAAARSPSALKEFSRGHRTEMLEMRRRHETGAVLQKLDGLMVPISAWVEGQLERTLFGSTKMPADKTRTIAAFRCATCGLLEFYAPEQ
jgi:hypothetical protein